MDAISAITPQVNPQQLNDYLIKKYEYSLFCFFLSYTNIFIKRTFLKKSFFPDSQTLQRPNEKLKNLKKRAQQVLKEYVSSKFHIGQDRIAPICDWDEFSGFIEFIDKEINFNKELLSSEFFGLHKGGLHMLPETKIALIFSLIMTKKIHVDISKKKKLIKKYKNTLTAFSKFESDIFFKKIFNDFHFDIFAKREMQKFKPDYDDIFNLWDWFHNQLSYLYPLNEESRELLRDRIRKIHERNNFDKILAGVSLVDLFQFIAQSYFEETNIQDPVVTFAYGVPIMKAFPTFHIEFGKDFIEIGEIVGDNLVYKKYPYPLNSKTEKILIRKTPIKEEIIPYKVVFPGGYEFSYRPESRKKLLAALLSKLLFYKEIYKG